MTRRLLSIDFMRGLAVIAMIEIHIWQAFIAEPLHPIGRIIRNASIVIGGNSAELFTMVSGVSASLLLSTYRGRGVTEQSIRHFILARGLFLFLLSSVVNILAGPVLNLLDISILNWSVIQLIGVCLLFAPLFSRSSLLLRIFWILLPWVLLELAYPRFPLFAPLFTGVAPVFPWGSFFFAGMWAGEYFIVNVRNGPVRHASLLMVSFGLLLAVPITQGLSVVLGKAPSWIHGNDVDFTTFTMLLGAFIILLSLSYYFLDQSTTSAEKLRPMSQALAEMGQRSLSIYYVQLIGVVLSALLLQRHLGYAVKINWVLFLPLVLFTLISIYGFVNIYWKRFGYFLSIEWFMAKLIRKPTAGAALREQHGLAASD
ncbi:MAG: DUF1624 domain-containing protein [Chloroflexi bacterium]|nr:DUF1624 domain-containing protein [Chloroflexota bacterium]